MGGNNFPMKKRTLREKYLTDCDNKRKSMKFI